MSSTPKGPLQVSVSVAVNVVVHSGGVTRVGVLARGTDRTKAGASEIACRRALTHLITEVRKLGEEEGSITSPLNHKVKIHAFSLPQHL